MARSLANEEVYFMKNWQYRKDVSNGGWKNWGKFSIMLSAFGLGSYGRESEKRYQEVMSKADNCIARSEEALARSTETLNRSIKLSP